MEFEQFKKGHELLEKISNLEKQIENCNNKEKDQWLFFSYGNGRNSKTILEGPDVDIILTMVSSLNKQKLEALQKEFKEL